jgi:hypothetical protein
MCTPPRSFATRSVSRSTSLARSVEVIRQCNLESWRGEQIQRSIDMYDAFGFNAVRDARPLYTRISQRRFTASPAREWREKVYALVRSRPRRRDDGFPAAVGQLRRALPVKELKGGYTPFGYVNLAASRSSR